MVKALNALVHDTLAPSVGYSLEATYRAPEKPAVGEQLENGANPESTTPPAPAAATDDSAGDGAGDGKGEEADHVVYLRLQDAASKAAVAVSHHHGTTADLALRSAGYWAAGWILSRSDVVPAWAKWNEEAGSVLALYQDADTEAKLSECEKAARLAPDSGLVLTLLGHRFDLEGRHCDALSRYLRASTLYPRFIVARYRLAVSLSLLAADLDETWWPASPETRWALIAEMQRLGAETMTSETVRNDLRHLALPGTNDDQAKRALSEFATDQLSSVRDLVARRSVWWQALDQAERAYWWPLRWGAERKRLSWLARSAAPAIQARGGLSVTELEKIRKEAEKRDTCWQVLYNLACYYAINEQPNEALEWLERSASRPGAHKLNAKWLYKDPDLKTLHGEPRFERLAASIRKTEEEV